jgi:hypothetical protein
MHSQSTRKYREAMMHRILLLTALSFLTAPPAIAQCIEDNRQVQMGAGVARLKGYVCRTKTDPARPSLRVEYLNIEEPLASLMIEGRSTKHLATLIGKPRIVNNEVTASFKALRSRFGREEDLDRTFEGSTDVSLVTVSPGAGGARSEVPKDKIDKGAIVMALPPVGFGDYPDIDGILHVSRQKTWPAGYAHFYTAPSEGFGFMPTGRTSGSGVDVLLWRYLNADDVANYPARVAAYNAWIKANVKSTSADDAPREIELLSNFERHLLAGGIPLDYAVIYGSTDTGCGQHGEFCCWSFSRTGRTPSLDVILLQNNGGRALKIDGLLGVRPTEEMLRARTQIRPMSVGAPDPGIANSAFELQPGERALVPLRLRLDVGDKKLGHGLSFEPDKIGDARRGFQQLQASRPSTEFSVTWDYFEGAESKSGTIKKVRESFEPPVSPKRDHLVFGPEWRVTGLEVAGEKVVLAAGNLNVLALSVGSAEGSCPHMMAWNPETKRWIEYGKVLHKATGKLLEQTDVRRLEGWRGQFRLEEREAEIAYLDKASLAVTLKNGRSLILEPDLARLAAIDDVYVVLLWGQAVEFNFKLPDGVSGEEVLETRLALSGFYDRYSAIVGQVARSQTGQVVPAAMK